MTAEQRKERKKAQARSSLVHMVLIIQYRHTYHTNA